MEIENYAYLRSNSVKPSDMTMGNINLYQIKSKGNCHHSYTYHQPDRKKEKPLTSLWRTGSQSPKETTAFKMVFIKATDTHISCNFN